MAAGSATRPSDRRRARRRRPPRLSPRSKAAIEGLPLLARRRLSHLARAQQQHLRRHRPARGAGAGRTLPPNAIGKDFRAVALSRPRPTAALASKRASGACSASRSAGSKGSRSTVQPRRRYRSPPPGDQAARLWPPRLRSRSAKRSAYSFPLSACAEDTSRAAPLVERHRIAARGRIHRRHRDDLIDLFIADIEAIERRAARRSRRAVSTTQSRKASKFGRSPR